MATEHALSISQVTGTGARSGIITETLGFEPIKDEDDEYGGLLTLSRDSAGALAARKAELAAADISQVPSTQRISAVIERVLAMCFFWLAYAYPRYWGSLLSLCCLLAILFAALVGSCRLLPIASSALFCGDCHSADRDGCSWNRIHLGPQTRGCPAQVSVGFGDKHWGIPLSVCAAVAGQA
jgi:hypothetical protein